MYDREEKERKKEEKRGKKGVINRFNTTLSNHNKHILDESIKANKLHNTANILKLKLF